MTADWLSKMFSILLQIIFISSCFGSEVYKSTKNISVTSFSQYKESKRTVKTILHCGYLCTQTSTCRAFHYNDTEKSCDISNIKYLENPANKQDEMRVYVKLSQLKSINMKCNGAESCCDRSYAGDGCGEGEGDCDTDNDCQGGLVCGHNNCLKYHAVGGHWDQNDDCCERLCREDNVCEEGQGTCQFDSDCSASTHCGIGKCQDTAIFPKSEFPLTSAIYNSTESCCYRKCNVRYNQCGHNEQGCLNDDDCTTGLYCKKSSPKNFCEDIDECQGSGKYYCGKNAYCTNTIGSFSCTCNSGYTSHVAYEGCSDYNECSQASSYCPNAQCVNYDGAYQCLCNAGFLQVGLTTCSDINECAFDVVTKSCPTTEKPGCYNTAGSYSCHPAVTMYYYGQPWTNRYGNAAIWNYDTRRYEGICDYLWSKSDADVFCRSVGYSYASSTYKGNRYGSVSGYTYYMSAVGCLGLESSILSCPYTSNPSCGYYQSSGAYCQ